MKLSIVATLEMQEDRTALVGPQPARDARAPDPI